MSEQLLSVGTRVWTFDYNRRVYPKGARGGPIYSEHFVAHFIVGEIGRSWLLNNAPDSTWPPKKVSKQKVAREYYTDATRDDAIYVHDNRGRIADAVRACKDVPTLRRIAELLALPDSAVKGPDNTGEPK